VTDKRESTKGIVEDALRSTGLQQGDTVLVFSDATAVMTMGAFDWWEDALALLKACFINVLGTDGTLIVPTFNWDFCSGKAYHYRKTLSQVGLFSNHILLDPESIRSFHPIYSFAGIGPAAQNLFHDVSKEAFGPGSVFERLHTANAKMMFFNQSFQRCTFIHYVEQCKQVDYREVVEFTGTVCFQEDDAGTEETFSCYVRKLNQGIVTSLERLEKQLFEAEKLTQVKMENQFPVCLTYSEDVFQQALKSLEEDPTYLIQATS
jgi:aminoglycoside 3-N-acetyltransferase